MNVLLYALSIFSVTAFGFFSQSTGESTLPVTVCKRNSADYSTCLKHALEEAWPRFVKGLPEFDFPALDPLFLERATAVLNLGEIHGEITASNLTAIGLSKTHFSDIRTHFLDDIFRLEIDAEVPWLYVESAVQANSTLSVFRITGKGHFNETLTEVRGTWDMTGHVVNDTWIVEHFRITPSVGKLKIYFDNLLEQGKEFNDVVVNFINEYWPALYRIVLPILADVYDPWLVDFPNKFFSKIKFSEIFP
ncbi:PREDICTED: uncharacterized protein LOC105567808 [Vollenhovia emeryi]|uniref:uncharacterized protein LOC105567808 n=1 Tax=Vollenhovia emeryi TaxID=411798 RepID=UPI0005F47F9A|nr:PREDICTED: uncharacterized protein LOC105567808 [Vollenhovia emeryi]